MAEPEPVTRKPEWLKTSLKTTRNYSELKGLLRGQGLHTVCEEARCPNLHECWGAYRTASFMILGDTCTRRCRFCAVKTGLPSTVDRLEPRRVAESVRHMGLRHAHVTMVNRDDLADGGAGLMAETVRAIRELAPRCSIEVLTSDFMGRLESIRTVVEAGPDITSHNLETVRRLTPRVRSRSDYDRSLAFLSTAKELAPRRITKSSLMLGLGESWEEVLEAMDDLRAAAVDMLNIGQYLQPSRTHVPVQRFWTPQEFARLREAAREKGFLHCEAGPLVRSSYHAEDQLAALHLPAAPGRDAQVPARATDGESAGAPGG
jgi:lipoic acid synthetase